MQANIFWPEILTVEQVAGILQLRPSTVRDLARRGELPSIKLGRHTRFDRDDLVSYVNAQRRQ